MPIKELFEDFENTNVPEDIYKYLSAKVEVISDSDSAKNATNYNEQ